MLFVVVISIIMIFLTFVHEQLAGPGARKSYMSRKAIRAAHWPLRRARKHAKRAAWQFFLPSASPLGARFLQTRHCICYAMAVRFHLIRHILTTRPLQPQVLAAFLRSPAGQCRANPCLQSILLLQAALGKAAKSHHFIPILAFLETTKP